ncbi:MAG: hypothetical protein H7A24_00975 [Leptospiraceae bacterium]|nr:hypothetical protein [Leptospiraceae bacterium]MCP5510424.1 hypothetical protein [Leptospiraceae bacterium]
MKRLFLPAKVKLTLRILLILQLFYPGFSIHPSEDPPKMYRTLLTESEFYYSTGRKDICLQKLDTILSKYPEHLEYGYYSLRGSLDEERGDLLKAMVSYKRALYLKPENSDLAKKILQFYEGERKLRDAFDFARIYLNLKPDDQDTRFRALVLSSRLGERKYFLYAEKKLGNSPEKEKEEEHLKNLKSHLQKKEYKEGYELSKRLLPHFAFHPKFHSYHRIFLKESGRPEDEVEESLIDSAAIFWKDQKYSFQLATHYSDRKKYFRAMNLFRRMLSQSLRKNEGKIEEEILYLIRDTYYKLDRKDQAISISHLIDLNRKKEKLDESDFFAHYSSGRNREFLSYLMYHFKEKESYYRSLMKERDLKEGDREYMNIFPLFDYEDTDV